MCQNESKMLDAVFIQTLVTAPPGEPTPTLPYRTPGTLGLWELLGAWGQAPGGITWPEGP